MYRTCLKRFLDVTLSFLAIIVLSPVFLTISILVRIKLGSPVLFRQKRAGKSEKIFEMYKFRTMTDQRDDEGNLLGDEQRTTKFGAMLRSTSLDELPELFNILKGDMSIVGPRSLLAEYLPYYTDFERQRHNVRGGLTPPEILYHNIRPTWEEQFRYEVEYAKNVSFFMDLKIVFFTIKCVFKRNNENYGSYVRETLIDDRKAKPETQPEAGDTKSNM